LSSSPLIGERGEEEGGEEGVFSRPGGKMKRSLARRERRAAFAKETRKKRPGALSLLTLPSLPSPPPLPPPVPSRVVKSYEAYWGRLLYLELSKAMADVQVGKTVTQRETICRFLLKGVEGDLVAWPSFVTV